MQSIETFDTERLVAHCLSLDDFDELCRLHQDTKVMATLGGVRSNQQTKRFLNEKIEHWTVHGFGYWMFRSQEDGAFVGRGGLQHIEIGGNPEVEVGYTVRAEEWGKGFATEMAKGLLNVGFTKLGLNNIVCFTLDTNHASQRVMEKVGFQFERTFVHAGQPHVLYRMLLKDAKQV